jgi:hypothetical protein
MSADNQPDPRYVPTWSLLGYLATILAWEAEVASLILHALGHHRMTIAQHVIVLTACGALSLFAWWRRHDFDDLRMSRGRIPLTGMQVVIVITCIMSMVFFVVCLGQLIFA